MALIGNYWKTSAIHKKNDDSIKERRDSLTKALARVNHELDVALKAKQEVDNYIANRHLLETKIKEQDFAIEKYQKLKVYSVELKDLNYDFEQHSLLKTEVQKYKKYEELRQKLSEYERLLENELRLESEATEEINKLNRIISENKNCLISLEEEISQLSYELNELSSIEQKI